MSNCDNDISSQIKALHARLDRVDEDLTAHFAAQYLQAISFLANPLTSAQGAIMTAQFASREALKALAQQLPFYAEFKQLQQLDSAALVTALETTLIQTAEGIVNAAIKQVETAIDNKIAALLNYTIALEKGAIDSVVGPLLNALNAATKAANSATSSLNMIQKFFKTLADISSCQIQSSVQKAPTLVDNVTPALDAAFANFTPAS